KARRADPWPHSTAPAGSALEAMENGSLMLRQFQGRHDKRMRLTVDVPPELREKLARELTNVFHAAARKVAKRYRIPVRERGKLHPSYEEVYSGAQLGFLM